MQWLKTWSLTAYILILALTLNYGTWASYLTSLWCRFLLCKMRIILFCFEHPYVNSKYTFSAVKQVVTTLHTIGVSPFCAGREAQCWKWLLSNTFWMHLRLPQSLKQIWCSLGIVFNTVWNDISEGYWNNCFYHSDRKHQEAIIDSCHLPWDGYSGLECGWAVYRVEWILLFP